MQITEVRIKLMDDPQERLQAFCSVTFDGSFVIRDLKIIQGTKGSFVAMPSRKLTDRCPKCHCKNQLRALYCNQCGVMLDEERAMKDTDGRAKLYADIAHPINSSCREMIQTRVVEAFNEELVRSRQSGYVCSYDDYGEEDFAKLKEIEAASPVVKSAENQPASFQTTDGKSHRVDPAVTELTTGPHDTQEQKKPVQSASNEDHFGEGII